MQKKVQFWMLMLVVASAAAVLSAPKETSKVTSGDQVEPDAVTNSIGMKLVRIPAGEFMMGAENRDSTMAAFPYADPALLPREWPRHKVRITKSFYMGQHEVTLDQFMTFLRDAGYKIDGAGRQANDGIWQERRDYRIDDVSSWAPGWNIEANHPVGYVSWKDAVAFCDWLSRKEGKKYRLPTEAEWKYASRAGTSTRFHTGNDPEELIGFANAADADRAAEFPGENGRCIRQVGQEDRQEDSVSLPVGA